MNRSRYDDEFAKTFDLEFMYLVERVVGVLHADGTGLERVEAPMNVDLFGGTGGGGTKL
jgi:hypothetical protein